MATTLPHGNVIAKTVADFLRDVESDWQRVSVDASGSPDFREIFKSVWATDQVLRGLSDRVVHPSMNSLRTVVRRIPVIVLSGQLDAIQGELRRFVELVFWQVYFSDHPIEWRHFSRSPDLGISRAQDKPIEYCSHRERMFYSNYASERMLEEPSGLAGKASDELSSLCNKLNSYAHAGREIVGTRVKPSIDSNFVKF